MRARFRGNGSLLQVLSMVTNKLAFWIGHHAAQCNDAQTIATMLQIDPQEVVATLGDFVPPIVPPGHQIITVYMSAKHRTKMGREARHRGLSMPDLVSQAIAVVVRDSLFGAVIDG